MSSAIETFTKDMEKIRELIIKDEESDKKQMIIRSIADKTMVLREMEPTGRHILIDFILSIGSRIIAGELEKGKIYDEKSVVSRLIDNLDALITTLKSKGEVNAFLEKYVTFVYSLTPPGYVAFKRGLIKV